MENTSHQKHIIAFIGKDHIWHFINEKTHTLLFEAEKVILNDEEIQVESDTIDDVLKLINSMK